MSNSKKAITVLSGGLDSTTLAYLLASQGYEQHFISFNYGQKHYLELECAAITARKLNGNHSILRLPLGDLLKGSSLTDDSVAVPHGHYEASSMTKTVVPGRNAIMLSIAWGIAVTEKVDLVALGVHAGDHAVYDDCRLEFIQLLENALLSGTGRPNITILTPFINLTKVEIVDKGLKLKVPYEDTYSCYEGKQVACGCCGTCVERLEAFDSNATDDPLQYKDRNFWVTVSKQPKI